MRFSSFSVESYGPLVGLPPINVSPQLTIVTGPNETGKSSLRAFMWMVLFGRKRSNAPDARWFNYTHAGGGQGRGSIAMESGGRNYTVYRREGSTPTVTDDATSAGEDLLKTLIGRIDGSLYQRVFSINLGDLQDLDLLTDDQVKGRIYSVGFGLGAVSLPDIKKAIENERSTAGGLWSERRGRLRGELEELATRTTELEIARSDLHSYESLNGEVAQISMDISKFESRRRDLSTEFERLRKVEELRNPWEALSQLRIQLEKLPYTDTFPPDGVNQLDRVTLQIESITDIIRDGDLEQRRRDGLAEKLPLSSTFELHDQAIRAVIDESIVYERLIRDLPGRQQIRREVESELEGKLRELGPQWSESRVATFTDTVRARAEIRRSGKLLENAIQQQNESQTAVVVAEQLVEASRSDLQSATEHLKKLGNPPSDQILEIERRRSLLEQLRRANNDRESYLRDVRDLETRTILPQTGNSAAVRRIVPATSALAGIALLAWGAITGEISGIAGGGLVLTITIPLWILTGIRGTHMPDGEGRSTNSHLQELRLLLEKSEEDTERLAGAVDLGFPPAGRDVQLALDKVGLELELRREYDRQQNAAQLAATTLKKTQSELGRLIQTQGSAESDIKKESKTWHETLRRWTLDEDIDLTAANDVIGNIEQIIAIQARVDTERQRVAGIESEIVRIDTDLGVVLEATASPVPAPQMGLSSLNELKRAYEADRHARVELRTLNLSTEDWGVTRESHQENLKSLNETVTALLNHAVVDTADDFRRLGEARIKRVAIEDQIRAREADNPLLVAAEGASYREELAQQTSEELNVQLSEFGDEIKILNTEILDRHGDRRTLEDKLRVLEESNPVAELQSAITVLTERVRADAGRWAVLTIAGQLIENASLRFQNQRQAPLLRSASEYFGQMTAEEYTSIQEVIGEDRLQVLNRSGVTKEVTELSRGTVEQLFLALRFALVEEYCRNTEPMPVLLDDVLVNFDPARARAAASAIVRLSQKHQVIALTCHPSIVSVFQEAAEDAGFSPPLVVNLPALADVTTDV